MCLKVRKGDSWDTEARSEISSSITSVSCHRHVVFVVLSLFHVTSELDLIVDLIRNSCWKQLTNNCLSTVQTPHAVLYHTLFPHSFSPIALSLRKREKGNLGETPSYSASTGERAHVYNTCTPSLIAHLSNTRLRWSLIRLSSSHSSSLDALISPSTSQHAFQM